jgi:hypothetical protein
LAIKNWLVDDVCIGCDRANKPMNMIDFLILESIIIEEKIKFIEE